MKVPGLLPHHGAEQDPEAGRHDHRHAAPERDPDDSSKYRLAPCHAAIANRVLAILFDKRAIARKQ
jgi:hypothetical protein